MISSQELIHHSNLISRDLSWLQFNHRVLDQAKKEKRNLFEKLKFLAITSSNADEFFMIRVGSLYNYLDFGNDRVDYSGLRAIPFKNELLAGLKAFGVQQNALFLELKTGFKTLKSNGYSKSEIIAVTGHNSEKGLNAYDSGDETHQRQMSHAIDRVHSSTNLSTTTNSQSSYFANTLVNDNRIHQPTFNLIDR